MNFVVATAETASAKPATRGSVMRLESAHSAASVSTKNSVSGTSVVTREEWAVRLGSRKQRNAAKSAARGPSSERV